MKFKIFPQDNTSIELLTQMAQEAVLSARSLAELLGMPSSGYQQIAESIHERQAHSTDLFYSLLTHMRSSFVNLLPREDLYELATQLHRSLSRLESMADMIASYRVNRLSKRAAEQLEIVIRQAELSVKAMKNLRNTEILEDYWLDMLRLGNRAERTHSQWLVELSDGSKAHSLAQHRDIAENLILASRALQTLSVAVGRIIVKES